MIDLNKITLPVLAYSQRRAALSHYISFLALSSFKCLSLQLTKSELNRTRNRKVLYTNITLPQDILVDKTFRSRDRFMMEETLPKWTCKISHCCCSSLAHPYPKYVPTNSCAIIYNLPQGIPVLDPHSTIECSPWRTRTHLCWHWYYESHCWLLQQCQIGES